jgi:hypothetical protein
MTNLEELTEGMLLLAKDAIVMLFPLFCRRLRVLVLFDSSTKCGGISRVVGCAGRDSTM